jgi:hypothetical protein
MSEVLPEALCKLLEPHVEALTHQYDKHCYEDEQDDFYERRARNERLETIIEEFRKETATAFRAFARERWPESEEYFDLDCSWLSNNTSLPF